MSSAILVPVSEYLAKSYSPDREYIDGELLERNVGEWDHSRLQGILQRLLWPYEDSAGWLTMPELRVQVKATRFRIPDLCVVRGNPREQILTSPPLICIEVLSPDDSMSAMQEKIEDYLAFGVANIWIFDPRRKKAYWADASGVHEASHLLQAGGSPIRLELRSLWP